MRAGQRIELGEKVRDLVTGFEGIAVCRTEWLNGCVRYSVDPPIDADGKAQENRHFDSEQLELVDGGVRAQILAQREEPSRDPTGGGGRADPQRPKAPPRR